MYGGATHGVGVLRGSWGAPGDAAVAPREAHLVGVLVDGVEGGLNDAPALDS